MEMRWRAAHGRAPSWLAVLCGAMTIALIAGVAGQLGGFPARAGSGYPRDRVECGVSDASSRRQSIAYAAKN